MDLTIQLDLPAALVSNERTRRIAGAFEMDDPWPAAGGQTWPLLAPTRLSLSAGQIAYLIGVSGSGKSQLLAALARAWPTGPGRRRRVVLGRLDGQCGGQRRRARCCVLDSVGLPVEPALRLLSAAGLGEPRTWLTAANRLSAGQADRLELARLYAQAERLADCGLRIADCGLNGGAAGNGSANPKSEIPNPKSPPVGLLIDEFGSRLDRLTARTLAANLRRWLNRTSGVAVVVASAHDDLADALAADWVWVKTMEAELRVFQLPGLESFPPGIAPRSRKTGDLPLSLWERGGGEGVRRNRRSTGLGCAGLPGAPSPGPGSAGTTFSQGERVDSERP